LFNHESPLRPLRFVTRKIVSTAVRIASGSKETLILGKIDIYRDFVTQPGQYAFDLIFTVGDDEARLPVAFTKPQATSTTPQGPMIIAAFLDDGELSDSGYYVNEVAFSSYSFAALAGPNLVIAWSDENANFDIDEGDFIGIYPLPVMVSNYQVADGVAVVLERVIGQPQPQWIEAQGAPAGWREALQEALRTQQEE
jgi:hypothetical protein